MICNQSHILAISSERKGSACSKTLEACSSQSILSILLYKFLTASYKRLARSNFPVKWFPTNLWKTIMTLKNRLLDFHYCCSEFNTFKTVFCNYVSSPHSQNLSKRCFHIDVQPGIETWSLIVKRLYRYWIGGQEHQGNNQNYQSPDHLLFTSFKKVR